MSRLDELIAELCPKGVEFKKIKDIYTRLKGTPITAGKMKEIDNYAVRMYENVGFKIVDENAEEYILVCEL